LQSHGLPLFVLSSLDLLPEEIFGEDATKEEDATPGQRVNHQLRCRIRNLEHNLRDITARCNAERERRMSLEVLVGGKISTFI
jgi:hypothetical protein